jgi:hypothetical protein
MEITEKTKIGLPLSVFVTILIIIISGTISVIWGLSNMRQVDDTHGQQIVKLECDKLDKQEYMHDKEKMRIRDSLSIERKLNLILKKLHIEEEY